MTSGPETQKGEKGIGRKPGPGGTTVKPQGGGKKVTLSIFVQHDMATREELEEDTDYRLGEGEL